MMSEERYSSVALLTCGESVKERWTDDMWWQYEEVIGVNWIACMGWRYDWLAVKDNCVVDDPRFEPPSNGIVSFGGFPKRWKQIEYENFTRWGLEPGWAGRPTCQYTFPDALKWVLDNWPNRSVDIYGLDMDSSQGVCRDNWRHDEMRWAAEMPWIRHLLETRGDRIRLVGCRLAYSPSKP